MDYMSNWSTLQVRVKGSLYVSPCHYLLLTMFCFIPISYSGTSKLIRDTLGSANFGIILLLYRGCPLTEVTLYYHDAVGTTQRVLYRGVSELSPVLERSLKREVPLYKQNMGDSYIDT